MLKRSIKEFSEALEFEIRFIEEFIVPLEKIEKLQISNVMIEDLKIITEKFNEIELDDDYNNHFISYVTKEIEEFKEHHFVSKNIYYRDSLMKIKQGEVNFDEFEPINFVAGFGGGGRAPQNKTEETIFPILHLHHIVNDFVEKFGGFIDNLYLLKEFSKLKTNIVIIGANGSGKSTLSRRLKTDNNENINIISSHHILYLKNENFIIPRYASEVFDIHSYQQSSKLVDDEWDFDELEFNSSLHNLVNYLMADHLNIRGNKYKEYVEKTTLETILEVCSELLKKNLIINENLVMCNSDSGPYDFNNMSDGERQVFFFVANVLVNENDGYIIVDEPENHLNPQICKALWNKLEELKTNSTFVYITHDSHFATSRINAEIIWSRRYNYPNDWEFEKLEGKNIPDQLLIEILGSKENVIICEGIETSSDYKVYKVLFPEHKIMPVGGHRNVKNYINVINEFNNLHIDTIGIIDSDGKNEEELESYKSSGIHVLPFNEIEMLLLSEEVLENVDKSLSEIGKSIDIDAYKNNLFELCKDKKELLIVTNIKSKIENHLESQKIKKFRTSNDLKASLNSVFENIDIDTWYKNLEFQLDNVINTKDYSQLLYLCSLKNEALRSEMHKYCRDYESIALTRISIDSELREKILAKYFNSLNVNRKDN